MKFLNPIFRHKLYEPKLLSAGLASHFGQITSHYYQIDEALLGSAKAKWIAATAGIGINDQKTIRLTPPDTFDTLLEWVVGTTDNPLLQTDDYVDPRGVKRVCGLALVFQREIDMAAFRIRWV
ncbi:hypothetical protein ACIQW5_11425 [Methylorubrum thiocyanatum]|uniref:hypothetical protein n=1 Tax=Methylorubrum thiocyanatum TaxID=47958 RepID=UPI00383AB3A9